MMPLKPLKTGLEAFVVHEVAPMYHLACFEGRRT
jgi:hypothetical protein